MTIGTSTVLDLITKRADKTKGALAGFKIFLIAFSASIVPLLLDLRRCAFQVIGQPILERSLCEPWFDEHFAF